MFDIKLLLAIDICTFFLTVVTTAVVRNGLEKKQVETETSFADYLKCGWNAVAGSKGLMTLVVMAAVMTFCMGVMQILSEPMVLDFESSRTLGIVETICAAGMLVTSGAFGFMFFAMIPVANSGLDYLVRTNIANELQGRAWGVIGFISQLGYVVSYGLSGVIADVIAQLSGMSVGRSCGALIMVSGCMLVVSALALYFTKSVRTLEKNG